MDISTIDKLDSILKMLPVAEQEELRKFIKQQQRTSTLHQELIKKLRQEMSLNKTVLNAAGDGIIRDLTEQDRIESENKKKTTELTIRIKELEGLYNLIKLREEENIPAIINKLFTEIVPQSTKHPDKAVTIIELDNKIYRSGEAHPVVALTSKLHNGTLTFGFTDNVLYGTEQHQKLLDVFASELDQAILKVQAGQKELQTERRAAMGELSADIAHNVNNGLQIIQRYIQIALESSANKDTKKLLEKIRNKTQELGANVRGIVNSTNYRPGENHFEIFDLGELIDDYLAGAENSLKSEALRQGSVVTITKQIGNNAYISGKKAEIILVTQALLNNSIDSFLEDGSMDINVSQKGEYVHLQVKDTGIGMNQETQNRLFEPSFTTKGFELGKGLNLCTAQKIVREHGGEINVLDSQMEQGTTIELRLPYARHQENEVNSEYERNHENKQKKPLSILWAEDDNIIQESIKFIARPLEDQIDFVANGKEALDKLQQKTYDVLITDIGMPVMGGWKLLNSIKGLYKNMPRVIASGFIINTNDLKASGASYLLNKPIQRDDIINILDNIKSEQQNLQKTAISHSRDGSAVARTLGAS